MSNGEESADATTEGAVDNSYERSRTESRRAQWTLNILVVFSAIAGSVFFFYVLYTIRPFSDTVVPPVDVPTNGVGTKIGLLIGTDEDSGVSVMLRDVDEAPGYREKLSEVMRRDAGISADGRLYVLVIENFGKTTVSVNARDFSVRDSSGKEWDVQWLEQAGKAGEATEVGKLRLAQSRHEFELATGQQRQVYVFVPSAEALPPTAEELTGGMLGFADGLKISLSHTEMKVAQ